MRQTYDRLISALTLRAVAWTLRVCWELSAIANHKYEFQSKKINLKLHCICTCSYTLLTNLPDLVFSQRHKNPQYVSKQ